MKINQGGGAQDRLRAAIRETGLRCTAARLAVLGHVNKSQKPLTHAEIATALSSHGLDRATVYRNLVEMTQAGLLSRHDFGDKGWRFERRRNGPNSTGDHPHFVCTECGDISCLVGSEIKIKPPRGSRISRVATVTEVLLKGRCTRCS